MTLQQDDTTSVLFIAGSQRSGSTILDRVIGMNDGFFSLGEMRFIWEYGFESNRLCGCGVPFHECAFWNEVSNMAFGVDAAQVDGAAAIKMKASVDRIRYFPWLTLPYRPASYKAKLDTYGALIARLYDAVVRISGTKVIVDSSKDPTQGLLLAGLPGVRVHVVHLVRDPRAVAFSWKRTRRQPDVHWRKQDMPTNPAYTSAGRWVMHNALAELLSRSAASYHRLRYEDFLADPATTLSKLLEPYEWIENKQDLIENNEILLEPTHSVSGNPIRFKHGRLKLKLDDEWRRAMPMRDRRLVTAITGPLLTRYGYPIRDTV